MERIALIGCGGSGKSTLARRMGNTLALPVHHLDRLYWKAEWIETPTDEWTAIQQKLCAQPSWIINGNYGGTMETRLSRADVVVFLDLPAWSCLAGAIRRYLRYRGRTRPELTKGCPERLTGEYLGWIWTGRRKRRPRILQRLQQLELAKQVVILGSHAASEVFLSNLLGRAR